MPCAAFTVQEVAGLTLDFFRRNDIEGLFLSSGVFRIMHRFRGYLHSKVIPGADPGLIRAAGLYADRMSVIVELPSGTSLETLGPDKSAESIFLSMKQIFAEKARSIRLVPAGQTTQMIIGASPETDLNILRLSAKLYSGYGLARVYDSAYIPMNEDKRLPALAGPPWKREHRLYQSDWLYRYYGFQPDELLEPSQPYLDETLDLKAAWALRHPEAYPVDGDRFLAARPQPLQGELFR